MKKRDLGAADFVAHMIDAARRVLQYTAGFDKARFFADTLVQDAVIRNIEILGEAANNLVEVAPAMPQEFPSIPFAEIYGMRNRICHGYFSVSLDMVWDAVQVDVPELLPKIEAVLREYSRGDAAGIDDRQSDKS